jgi:hypothetical protein
MANAQQTMSQMIDGVTIRNATDTKVAAITAAQNMTPSRRAIGGGGTIQNQNTPAPAVALSSTEQAIAQASPNTTADSIRRLQYIARTQARQGVGGGGAYLGQNMMPRLMPSNVIFPTGTAGGTGAGLPVAVTGGNQPLTNQPSAPPVRDMRGTTNYVALFKQPQT